MEKKTFNLVYDVWDNDSPIANLKIKYPWIHLTDPDNLILHYMDDSTYQNKFTKRRCKIEDIFNSEEKYYYVVDHGGNQLIELFVDERNGNNIITMDPFDEGMKELFRSQKNLFLMFLTEHEPDCEISFKYLHNYLVENNIPREKVYVVNNNAKLYDYKIDYNSDINVHPLQFIPHSSTKVLVKVGGNEFVENKEGKFFMCFNKSPKIHRYVLLCYLKKNNLLDNINWSLVPTWNSQPMGDFYRKIFDKEEIEEFSKEIDYFYNIDIKRSDYEIDKGWFNPYQDINTSDFPIWLHIPEFMKNYESSYVNIITESMFLDEMNSIHISEKSFRPFFYYQFPLILGTSGHIRKMKDRYGFDFYDDILNHDYDDEPIQLNRMEMFVKEIKRLNGMRPRLIEYYKKNKERFELNKQKVINVLDTVNVDYKFFESLI
jgi:hypothetical protein